MVDKFVKVVVKDAEGKEFTAAATTPVQNDASTDVSIIDINGLQSDGTGIIGDTLRISYGVTFGTVTAASWYKDGSVVATMGSGNSGIGFDLQVTPTLGTGTYKATVVSEGKLYETNEIVITNKEEAAVIKAFTVEDDYTDGEDITYETDDATAVATVTLAKNYEGKLRIYKANDSKYSSVVDTVTTDTTTAENSVKEAQAIAAKDLGDGTSILTTDAATNYNVLNVAAPGAALGHINADGTVTYKYVFTGTRGTEYKITFDQDSVLTDTPGTGTANVFADATKVPYVTAPAKIAVTKVANNNYPEVTFQDADGNALTWMQGKKGGDTLSNTGIDKAAIYKSTAKTTDSKAKTVEALSGADETNPVEKGVWTAGDTADTTAYWFAEVTTKKGIYGETAVTLTSEAVPVAQNVADMMNLKENANTATTATVEFKNLRAAGTVYIVQGKEKDNDADTLYAYYTGNTSEQIVANAKVEAGAASVDVEKAISSYQTAAAKSGENYYIAVFIPDDQTNYGMIYTDSTVFNRNDKVLGKDDVDDYPGASDDDSAGVIISQKPTSVKFNKKGAGGIELDSTALKITMTNVETYDQFGEILADDMDEAVDVTSVTATDKTLANTEKGAATYFAGVNGEGDPITIVNLTLQGDTDNKDGYTIKLLGSDLTVFNKSGDVLGNTDIAGWEVKLGSDTVVAVDEDAVALQAAVADVNNAIAAVKADLKNKTSYGSTDITSKEDYDVAVGLIGDYTDALAAYTAAGGEDDLSDSDVEAAAHDLVTTGSQLIVAIGEVTGVATKWNTDSATTKAALVTDAKTKSTTLTFADGTTKANQALNNATITASDTELTEPRTEAATDTLTITAVTSDTTVATDATGTTITATVNK